MRANNFIDMTGKRFDRLLVINLERMMAYENYMKEHHVDSLPRRIAL